MIFPFFLLASKTDKPLVDDTFQNQSVNSSADRPFPSYGSLTAFFYSPFKLKLMPSNDEFPWGNLITLH